MHTVIRRLLLTALAGAVALCFADSSIVVLALPRLMERFGASVAAASAVVTAYNVILLAALLPLLRHRRRSDPRRTARTGLLVFMIASAACAVAPGIWFLVAFRSLQGLGAALLLAASFPLARSLAATPARGSAAWAAAGMLGAAVGPAAGGLLTDVLDWRAIFLAQLPLAAAALAATVPRAPAVSPAARNHDARVVGRLAANVALALVSAALVALLFLAVLLLTNVWGLSTAGAALVASIIPLAMLAAGRALRRSGSLLPAGVVLVAGGLAGMALVPERSLVWAIAALALAGAGLGLIVPRLTATAVGGDTCSPQRAAWTLVARHAGLVLGLLVLTPVLSADLSSARERATLSATARVLEAPVSTSAKLRLGIELAPALADPGRRPVPDLAAQARGTGPEARLAGIVDDSVRAAFTRAFRRSFLLASGFALLAVLPLALVRRSRAAGRVPRALPAAAVLATVALLAGELGSGALAYGAAPQRAPCSARAGPAGGRLDLALQRAALRGLDAIACHVGKGREQLLVDVADEGAQDLGLVQRAGSMLRGDS